jgi:hypothetical protein
MLCLLDAMQLTPDPSKDEKVCALKDKIVETITRVNPDEGSMICDHEFVVKHHLEHLEKHIRT